MGIVETDQALPAWTVQRQRVVEPVRSRGRRGHATDRKPYPVVARAIHHQHLAVELQQRIEARVASTLHRIEVIIVRSPSARDVASG